MVVMMLTIGNDIQSLKKMIRRGCYRSMKFQCCVLLLFNSSFQASTERSASAMNDLLRDIYGSLEL
jgi:hypothetical protein